MDKQQIQFFKNLKAFKRFKDRIIDDKFNISSNHEIILLLYDIVDNFPWIVKYKNYKFNSNFVVPDVTT